MTNHDRVQARIERSKARRAAKRLQRAEQYGRIEKVISNQTLFRSLVKRKKGTDWKQSVQDYVHHFAVRNKRSKDAILSGALPTPSRIREINLYERGKARRVHAVVIDSRVIQGAVCDRCITPLMQPGLIMDNPASVPNKGVSFARQRIEKHLRRLYRQYGDDAHVLLFDFKGFFDSIRHDLCRRTFERLGMDKPLIRLAMHFVQMYQIFDADKIGDPEDKAFVLQRIREDRSVGVSLGSQISQNLALVAPDHLDHVMKDREAVKAYMRYMDDGAAGGSRQQTRRLSSVVLSTADSLGLHLHRKKTHTVKLTRGFVYLKIRYTMTKSGHLIKRIAKAGIVRMRRKLRKMHGLVARGICTLDDVFNATMSWMGNAARYSHSYHSRHSILDRYFSIFKGYRMKGVTA